MGDVEALPRSRRRPSPDASRPVPAIGPTTIPLALIRTDGGTQSRAQIDPDVVAEYAEAYRALTMLPPLLVIFDGESYWLADGFHRLHALLEVDVDEAPVELRQGTRRDAVLTSCGVNATHGLRRSSEDKRRAVEVLLRDPEWSTWSDREIGRRCAVDHKLVGRIRGELTGESPSERTYTTKHGTTATMDTAAIGRTPPAPIPTSSREERLAVARRELAALEPSPEELREVLADQAQHDVRAVLVTTPTAVLPAPTDAERVADLLRVLVRSPVALDAFLASVPDLMALREQLANAIETSGALDF